MTVVVVRPGDASRAEAEALARRMFRLRHGAEISHLPSRLLAVRSPGGRLVAVAGLRDADEGFFSERYLDLPVERAIAGVVGSPTRRDDVLELTALAAERTAPLLALLRAAAAVGLAEGRAWGLFTGTRVIRGMALRLGMPLVELAIASRERAPDPASWGVYYERDPRVCAVEIGCAAASLSADLAVAAS
jgi:hypothetical protein